MLFVRFGDTSSAVYLLSMQEPHVCTAVEVNIGEEPNTQSLIRGAVCVAVVKSTGAGSGT